MLAVLFITHFIVDGMLQSREVATKKSEQIEYLMQHLAIQFFGFLFVLLFSGHGNIALQFSFLNIVAHGIIDWNIWRWYKRSVMNRIPFAERRDFKYYEDKGFYDTIMFDQLLHALTIILLWQWLTQ